MLVLVFPLFSRAVLVGHFESRNENPNAPVHVLISGRGGDVGTLFQQAAISLAHKIAEQPGHGPIVTYMKKNTDSNLGQLAQWGVQAQDDGAVFNTTYLVRKLSGLRQGIASIEFFGHNSAAAGFQLDGPGNRLPPTADGFEAIKGLMIPGSFVRLNGCNTGYYLAPWMANRLGVPVAGTFASDDFQELYTNKRFYYHDEGRYPGGPFAATNAISYATTKDCANGGCVRIMPVHFAYSGAAGESTAGLSILKFFCPKGDNDDCAKVRARALRLSVGIRPLSAATPFDQVVDVLAEQFCPAYLDAAKYSSCVKALKDHGMGIRALPRDFTTFGDRSLACNNRACAFTMKCGWEAGHLPGICHIDAAGNDPSTVFMDEFDATLRGWKLSNGR